MDFTRVSYPVPHIARGRQLLATHPELRALSGPTPSTAAWVVGLVAMNITLAVMLAHTAWYVWVPVSYIVIATADHALWVLIHETTHNLVFRKPWLNKWVALIANLPMLLPAAISFSRYHLLHHRHLGDPEMDAGVPGETEARIVGESSLLKTMWIAFQSLVQGVIRPNRVDAPLVDGWTIVNAVFQFASMGLLIAVFGLGPIKCLLVGVFFALGLHPLGGRWVQEHTQTVPGQETYSYYGPLNRVAFNIGYHNEHHDLISVPWSKLPDVRRIAPEFYDPLYSYASLTRLLLRFCTDRQLTLYSYIVRTTRRKDARAAAPVAPSQAVLE